MHTRSNGARHRIEVNDSDIEQRCTTLEYALTLYTESATLHKSEVYAVSRVLGESGLLAYSHIARIAGTSVSTLKRNGVRVPGQRKGGVFNPAQLDNVVRTLQALKNNGTYMVQCIREAHENGISAQVLGRFFGLSHTYVLTLVRMAANDRDLVATHAHARRAGNRENRLDAGVSEFTVATDSGTDDDGFTPEERALLDRFADYDWSHHISDDPTDDDPVNESGTAADETGQLDGTDHSATASQTSTDTPPNDRDVSPGHNSE